MRTMTVLLVALQFAASARAQAVPEKLAARNQLFREHVTAKDYPAAVEDIRAMLAMPEIEGLSGARGSLLYNEACLHALLGQKSEMLDSIRSAVAAGYTKYERFATDADFDAYRGEAEFKALLAEIKKAYGPKPLVWDDRQPAPRFRQSFDGRHAPGLKKLRAEFATDAVVAGIRDEYARLIAITKWASGRWQHSSNQMASKADPLTILREAKAGGRFICRDYAIVTAGVASVYGMRSRLVNLLPADVETRSEAHAVAEVWLPRFGKWVIADGQYGIVPELAGTPLSAVELQAALADELPVQCRGDEARCAEWKRFIVRNMYYFKTMADQRRFEDAGGSMLILVPKGAPNPTKFAGGNEELFAGAVYTSNPKSFYASPARR
jgi:hypothetical protein